MGGVRRASVIITGATGFLGGHLLAALLRRGERVVALGRPRGEETLAARMGKLLEWFGLQECAERLKTLEVDPRKPRCGLDEERYRELCASSSPIVHCASDTRFSERMRAEVTEANLTALEGLLALAIDSRAARFHYISTAYVAGKRSGECPEELTRDGGFTNVYEETKALAERRVAESCLKAKVPYTIIRPSVVYGDSRTGRSTRFNALYHPVKSLSALREMYENDIRLHGGKRARTYGIEFAETGALKLPLRFFLPHRGRINLIPVDYFTSAVLSVMDRGEAGGVFHLTTDSPKSFDDLTAYCLRYLDIEGIRIVDGYAGGASLSPPESLLQRYLEPYLPYFSDTRHFSRERAVRATGGLPVPELTYDVFKRCMDYAVSVDWEEGAAPRPPRDAGS